MTSTLRPVVTQSRERLATGRSNLKTCHQQGAPGLNICTLMSDLLDTVLLELIRDIFDEVTDGDQAKLDGRVALVPHGGYGRRDVAPYSDVDLMLLYRADSFPLAEQIARRLNRDVPDIGLSLGFSARTPKDACGYALKEAEVFTSLAESRYLSGSYSLYRQFMTRLARQSRDNARLIKGIEEKRLEERGKYGETVYLLRPNVKRSAGALRDIQLIRWLGMVRFGETDIERIFRLKGLHASDFHNLVNAREFLLRLRNEMHFHAGKAQDLLGKNEQLRIAELLNYESRDENLPVEIFMQDYFRHSSQVVYAAEHFLESAKNRFQVGSIFEPLFSRSLETFYRIGPSHIGVAKKDVRKVQGNLDNVLHLMNLANLYDKRIDHFTWRAVRDSMREMGDMAVSPDAAKHFVEMLSQSNRLGSLIRLLHELRVLEKLIPGFKKARGLIQFNQYHKYTVDEHTLLALDVATGYVDDRTAIGKAYRAIKHRERLHLAILLHDIGKGYAGDHSDVGAELADETCNLLGLTPSDTKAVRFLVQNHLMMAHLALRRDISDESVVAQFAADVGRPDYLQMLFVLTCADLTAVGPDVLSGWKRNLLTELYHRAMFQLSGENPAESAIKTVEPIRQQIKSLAQKSENSAWFFKQIDALSSHFLSDVEPGFVFELLSRLLVLPPKTLSISCRYLPAQKACEFTIGKHDEAHSGVLYKLTGAISGAGLDILTASISYLHDPMVLYRFVASDSDHIGEPPAHRLEEIKKRIENSVLDTNNPAPKFRKTWGSAGNTRADQVTRKPTRVRIDNVTSEKTTIIDIFTHDRVGLLYTITKKIYDLGLQVRVTKVGTYVDQVVDVFYVTDSEGKKIVDDNWLEHIRQELLNAVDHPPNT